MNEIIILMVGVAIGLHIGKMQWCKRKYGHFNIYRNDVHLWSGGNKK